MMADGQILIYRSWQVAMIRVVTFPEKIKKSETFWNFSGKIPEIFRTWRVL